MQPNNNNPAVRWIVENIPSSGKNNIYSPGSDKLTYVQWYVSTSYQLKSPNQNVKGFSTSEKARISSWVNSFIATAVGGLAISFKYSVEAV